MFPRTFGASILAMVMVLSLPAPAQNKIFDATTYGAIPDGVTL